MRPTWKSLSAEVRTQARALAANGLPHPDPAVQAAIAARHLHLSRLFQRSRLVAAFVPVFIVPWAMWVPWAAGLEFSITIAVITATQFLLLFVGLGFQFTSQIRYGGSGRLAAPNIYALALAASDRAPASRDIGRSRRRLTIWLSLALTGVTIVVLVALVVKVANLGSDTLPGTLVLGMFGCALAPVAIGVGVAVVAVRRMDPRVSATLSDAGIHVPDSRLTLDWSEVVRVHAAPQPPAQWRGIVGLAILLRDPELVLARMPGRFTPRLLRWSLRRQHGWILVQDIMMSDPVEDVVAAAISLHRASLKQQASGTRQVPDA